MSQFGFLGSVVGGIVGGPAGWTVGGLIGNQMDRQEQDRKSETSERSERLLTINETQMTQLINQALTESKTRGPFQSVTFENVGEGFVVLLNFQKTDHAEGAD